MSTDKESQVADRVATALTGKFYVGQKVRLSARGRAVIAHKHYIVAEITHLSEWMYETVAKTSPVLTRSGDVFTWAIEPAE